MCHFAVAGASLLAVVLKLERRGWGTLRDIDRFASDALTRVARRKHKRVARGLVEASSLTRPHR